MSIAVVEATSSAGLAPRAHAAHDVAAQVAKADRLEQAPEPDGLLVASRREQDVALGVDHPCGPRSDGALRHRHVERAGNVGTVEGARLAAVHEDGALVEPLLGRLRCERLEHGRLRQERAAVRARRSA